MNTSATKRQIAKIVQADAAAKVKAPESKAGISWKSYPFSLVAGAYGVLMMIGIAWDNGRGLGSLFMFLAVSAPIFVSELRGHHNRLPICVVDALAVIATVTTIASGWGGPIMAVLVFMISFPCWLVALIWSLTKST
jgi:hypothetical protein